MLALWRSEPLSVRTSPNVANLIQGSSAFVGRLALRTACAKSRRVVWPSFLFAASAPENRVALIGVSSALASIVVLIGRAPRRRRAPQRRTPPVHPAGGRTPTEPRYPARRGPGRRQYLQALLRRPS